jgi:hypothetical protein
MAMETEYTDIYNLSSEKFIDILNDENFFLD